MKKSLRIAIAVAILLAGFSQSLLAEEYFWNSGTQATPSWHVTGPGGNWRIGSLNGSFAALPPTNADNVNFVAGSFGNSISTITIAVSQAGAAKSFNYNINNKAVTLRISNILEIAGSLTITNGNNNNKLTIDMPNTLNGASTAVVNGNVGIRFTAPLTSPSATIKSGASNPTTYGVPVIFDAVGGKWSLTDNMTVSQRVTFRNGYVDAPVYNQSTPANSRMLIMDGTYAVPFNASNNSHVIGYVQKLSLTGTMVMPVGDGTTYRPITATLSNSNTITAKYFNGDPNSNIPTPLTRTQINQTNGAPELRSVSQHEYWFLTSSGNSGLTVDLSYDRPDADQYYFINDPWRRTMLTVAGWKKTGGWSDINRMSATSINVAAKTIQSNGSLNNCEYFTIGTRGVSALPVRLVSFTGQQLDGQVQLKWQSSSEENTSHFEVEKSADGKSFSQVLTKKAQGNSSSLVSYNAIDNSPLSGTSYYRLKMVDLDGTFEYSKMVAVSAESELLVRAYPNPSKGNSVHLIAGNGTKLVLKSVSDLFGKQVGYQAANAPEGLQVNFAQPLPAGFYVATLAGNDNGQLVKVKFVVQ